MSHPASDPTARGIPPSDLESHLNEIAEILAAGLMRLKGSKSSAILAGSGESSVGFGPQPSGDAPTFSRGVEA